MPTQKENVVKVYVRLGVGSDPQDRGDESSRDISFRIPEGIDAIELLDNGFAIDGNQAVASVAFEPDMYAFEGPFNNRAASLSAALRDSQQDLVSYLREHGFQPEFN